ncbi:MAG: tRNA 2-thiocytidine biosynthesis TtcA family protein [bacterium]|nr:tRNA 2-thiocytidine biosynthesis TtcA family protein [bacterium]
MIAPNDRILIGLSGGKDSSFLTYALSCLRESKAVNFEIGAATIDLGLSTEPIAMNPLREYCSTLGLLHYDKRIDAGTYILDSKYTSPCAKCAHLRRGALVSLAKQEGYNKIAYAHHLDDAAETFLMNIMFSGKIATFQPSTTLDRNDVQIIRPLCYFREKEIISLLHLVPFTPLPSNCPLDKCTTRQTTKALLAELEGRAPNIFGNITACMRHKDPLALWPPPLSSEELRPMFQSLMDPCREQ